MTSSDRTPFWRMFARSIGSNLYLDSGGAIALPLRFLRPAHAVFPDTVTLWSTAASA
jgi:hypothetical protein